MNGSTKKYEDYEELQEHEGSKKIEVVTLIKPEEEVKKVLLDNATSNIIIQAVFDPIKDEDYYLYTIKANQIGTKIDSFKTSHVLKNGADLSLNKYSNWLVDGKKSKLRYQKPYINKSYDPKEWLYAFKEEYDQASASYYFNGTFYLKINSKWNAIKKNFEVKNFNFDKHFPDKYATVRMVELTDRSPSYAVPPEERDSSLIKQMDYESVFEKEVESAGGWTSSTYSAGWWYMQIYMPGADTLKVKRFSSYRSPDMSLYKIPEHYGGRKNVLFIVLHPKDAHPEQVGGMYVVRPRALGEKEKAALKN